MTSKNKEILHRFLAIGVLALCLSSQAVAQNTGFIRGQVVDKETREPLPGVNVLVVGTYHGAATDEDGNFIVRGISPGEYTLRAQIIGYTTVEHTEVKVNPGSGTTVNFEMPSTVLAAGQEVIVIGERSLFNPEETATRKSITADEIEKSTIESVQGIVSNQVGVVESNDEIHIRGGRAYENAYLVDGLSAQDPLAGTGFGLQLSSASIAEVEVITGGFNAEYGQAMSGVVKVRTKEGGKNYHGVISYRRDHFPWNQGTSSDFNTDILDFTLSGPEPVTSGLLPTLGLAIPGRLTFFTNLYGFTSDDYTQFSADQLSSSTAYGTKLALRQNNKWSGRVKLTWRSEAGNKLTGSYHQSVDINQNTQTLQTKLEYEPPAPGYPYRFQDNLDNFNTFTHANNQFALGWTQTLSQRTFYELKVSRFFTNLRSDLDGRHWTGMTEPKDIVTRPIEYFTNEDSSEIYVIPGDGFYDYGNSYTWHDHFVEDYILKFDLSSQINERHSVKSGMEATYREMQLIDIYAPWAGEYGLNNDMYRVHPNFGAAYIQDKIVYDGLIANVGLRFDYWFPGKYVEDAVEDTNVVTISPSTREAFWEDTYGLFGRRWKGRISPRIGISHPVSDRQVLFFNYGHFNKRPRPQFVYAKLGTNTAKSTFQTFGNPNLDPETTVSYELGVKHRFTANDILTLTAFYKDIFDYVTSISVPGTGRLLGRSFITYVNLDYARSRGLEMEYKKRAGRFLTGSVSGTYSIATGKSSSPSDALLVAQGDLRERPITENYLFWDRPWQFQVNLNFNVGQDNRPALFGLKLPPDWNLNIRWFAQAGERYTPQYFTGDTLDNGRKVYSSDLDQDGFSDDPLGALGKYWSYVNVKFEKYYTVGEFRFVFSAEVLNLFNRKNPDIINPVTGKAYEWGDPTPNGWNDPRYPDTQAPIYPYPLSPARWLNPRNIKLGVKFEF